ncbi:MAG: septum formation initiator family protein [Coriobacteriaceae bacterium]|nr:septum formation initiator family protein [Coriobacteriaceae bacterium]
MTRQGNILSFDEVVKPAASLRDGSAVSRPTGKRPIKRENGKTVGSKPASVKPAGAKVAGAKVSGTKVAGAKVSGTKASSKPPAKIIPKPASKAAAKDSQKGTPKAIGKTSLPIKGTQIKQDAKNQASHKQEAYKQGQNKQEAKAFRISRFSEMRRNLSKSKASREFTKQFGNTTSAASVNAPRAALYKAEMGRHHKKATQMQNGASGGLGLRGFSGITFPSFSNGGISRLVASFFIVVFLGLSGFFLYDPAKQYYLTIREYDRIEAEYNAVLQRNEDMRQQIAALSSPAGIEDRAREEFGWVKQGESTATVYGLESTKDETTYRKGIPEGSVSAPQTWYSPMLDVLFGVEG